jgi:hypothetical protein
VNATGFRPNLDMLREIRLELDDIVEAPRRLAPLIDPNVHSCGTVEPHGFAELTQPERDFFIVGMKSYGRARRSCSPRLRAGALGHGVARGRHGGGAQRRAGAPGDGRLLHGCRGGDRRVGRRELLRLAPRAPPHRAHPTSRRHDAARPRPRPAPRSVLAVPPRACSADAAAWRGTAGT